MMYNELLTKIKLLILSIVCLRSESLSQKEKAQLIRLRLTAFMTNIVPKIE